MVDVLLFGALPYVAVALFLCVSIWRYRKEPYTFSSLSSQFLETDRLFWGSVPFHVGVMVLFFGHLIGFLFPRYVIMWNQVPVRLFILEATGFAAAILMFIGLVGLVARRLTTPRLKLTTSKMDLVVYFLLFFQVVTGMSIALGLRWGSAWYSHHVVPYLWSLVTFTPEVNRMAELPLLAQVHVLGAFALIGVFSFTRLVHFLVAPVPYLWRPVQVVIWNRARRRAANSRS